MPVERDPIVVGVHGASAAVVTWASRHAAIEGRPLRLVHAEAEEFAWLLANGAAPAIRSRTRPDDAVPPAAVLDSALDVVEAIRSDQLVSARAEVASPARLLLREAGPASTIVVGNHGTSVLRHVLAGTIWQAILLRAACPVVAVTGRPVWPDAPIVVGIDAPGTARAAVEFGYAHAARCGVPLHLCHVLRRWPRPRTAMIAGIIARHRLLEYSHRYPQVSATALCLTGDPVQQLTDASTDARLLVVGSRVSTARESWFRHDFRDRPGCRPRTSTVDHDPSVMILAGADAVPASRPTADRGRVRCGSGRAGQGQYPR